VELRAAAGGGGRRRGGGSELGESGRSVDDAASNAPFNSLADPLNNHAIHVIHFVTSRRRQHSLFSLAEYNRKQVSK